jgi:hypothetical protein
MEDSEPVNTIRHRKSKTPLPPPRVQSAIRNLQSAMRGSAICILQSAIENGKASIAFATRVR